MRRYLSNLAISVLTAVLAGCVLSKTTIEERTPELKYATKGSIVLTVIDNRPFVLNGEKPESVEGIFRDGYGIPHKFEKMRDDSDTLYAARISEMLSKALYNSGSTVSVVQTKKGSTMPDAISALRTSPFDRGLLINVRDSRIDAGGFRWSYFFDYDVVVIDSHGSMLSSKTYSGEDIDFQREIFHSGSEKGKSYSFAAILDIEYKNKFSAFLSDRETQLALGAQGAPSSGRAVSSGDDGDGAKRLAALKNMLDKGLITKDDYEKKKAEILQSL